MDENSAASEHWFENPMLKNLNIKEKGIINNSNLYAKIKIIDV